MATETIIRILCDVCLNPDDPAESRKVEGENFTMTLGSMRIPRVLGLCAEHQSVYQRLYDLVAEHGQTMEVTSAPAPSQPEKAEKVVCQICGRRVKFLRRHIGRTHEDVDLADYLAEHPNTPLDPDPRGRRVRRSSPTEVTRAECPECDQVYDVELGNTRPRQALGIHARKTHGKSLAELLGEEALPVGA